MNQRLLPLLAESGAGSRGFVFGPTVGDQLLRLTNDAQQIAALELTAQSFVPWRWREAAVRRAFFAADSEIPDHWRGGWWLGPGLAQAAAITATPGAEFWSGGTAPMLVLQAEEDAIAPPADSGLRLAAEYPERVELVLVAGAGHAFLPEQPGAIEDAILAFLADIDSRS